MTSERTAAPRPAAGACDPVPSAPRTARPARTLLRGLARTELYVPLVYAAFAGAWIATSDLLVGFVARSVGQQTTWSMMKGLAFVVVTALLLHAGLRRALARERAAHRRVETSEAVLRAITDAIPDPVFLKDRDCRWQFASPAVLRALGKREDEVIGRTDREIYEDQAIAEGLMATDRRIMESGAAEVVEERIQTPSGYRLFLTTKAPFRDLAGNVVGVIGNARDITLRKEGEDALREQLALKEQVRQAQKLESVGRLAGGVAHDFNNLLTVVLGCAEALRRDAADGLPASAEDVEEIRAAGERARDLTRQLLAVARRQVVAPVPLDLNAVLRKSEKLLRRVLGEDVELAVDLQPDPWRIRADEGQLEQVVLNLAVNARDAMPRGGKLTLRTRNGGGGGGTASGAERGEVCLAVEDSGSGMTPEVRAHLFEPFFTTKPPGEGTGLGLATVYGIVAQAGGRIHVETAAGRGTTFELWFPRTLDAPEPHPSSSPRRRTARGTERVLVVEDDAQVREVTVRALRAAGYRVLVAGSGREALALGDAELDGLDLVVTDVVMPGIDGRSMADELQRRRPGVRVLYVSGYTEDAVVARGVASGGTGFLPKPFTPSALLESVRAVLDAAPLP
jgi:two-component system cell cycle sensor histidine kinase/response regulator CckA